jgi:hypothetical protein
VARQAVGEYDRSRGKVVVSMGVMAL